LPAFLGNLPSEEIRYWPAKDHDGGPEGGQPQRQNLLNSQETPKASAVFLLLRLRRKPAYKPARLNGCGKGCPARAAIRRMESMFGPAPGPIKSPSFSVRQ